MEFLTRVCPTCSKASSRETIRPPVSALQSDWTSISRSWSGLFNKRMFFPYYRCEICGLLYNPKYFNAAQLDELYRDMAPNMAEAVDPAVLSQTQHGYVDLIRDKLKGSGGYLEIGADIGTFATACSKDSQFSKYWFVEPNITVWDTLQAAFPDPSTSIDRSLDAIERIPERSLKLAVAIHVLDHIIDPLPTLRLIGRKLAPDGIFLSVTHDERSILAKALRNNWPAYCLQHPHLFNAQTIADLMTRAQYRSVEVRRTNNVFPAGFLIRQAAWTTIGKSISSLGVLDSINVKLKLGNIAAIARPGEV